MIDTEIDISFIEKYQQQLLSPTAAHGNEKAALEDPFPAEALEGNAETGTTLHADLQAVKNRLAQRPDHTTTAVAIPAAANPPTPGSLPYHPFAPMFTKFMRQVIQSIDISVASHS